jgi:tRNA 2-selenouridine synthase
MSLARIKAEEALAAYNSFHTVVDARSESEYGLDHLPGALNWPTLNDAQRHQVGTEYKQVSPFDARKRGAAMAAANIAHHVEQQVMDKPRSWQPLVYCWRGGQRSGALATVLGEIGFRVTVLDGGYRAFRRAMLADLEVQPRRLGWRVLCGPTGSAKSRLLQALQHSGAQVLDLETLACHRGSVLGPEPGLAQPSQKAFETAVWNTLRAFDASRPVFVESESRTIGRLRLPETLLVQMRSAACIRVGLSLDERVRFLLGDYAHLVDNLELFCERLDALRELRGASTVERWQALARQRQPQDLALVVQELLTEHYDPVYLRSMQRNYMHFETATALPLPGTDITTLRQVACALMTTNPCIV